MSNGSGALQEWRAEPSLPWRRPGGRTPAPRGAASARGPAPLLPACAAAASWEASPGRLSAPLAPGSRSLWASRECAPALGERLRRPGGQPAVVTLRWGPDPSQLSSADGAVPMGHGPQSRGEGMLALTPARGRCFALHPYARTNADQ